jgi:hypothetical protein
MATWKEQIEATGASAKVADAIMEAGYTTEDLFQECVKDAAGLVVLLKSALIGIDGVTTDNSAIHPVLVKLKKLLPAHAAVAAPGGHSAGSETNASKKGLKPEQRKEYKTFYEASDPGNTWGSDRTCPADETLLAFAELVEKAPPTAAGPFKVNAAFVPYFRIMSVQEARDRDMAREEKKAAREAMDKRDGKKRKREVMHTHLGFACLSWCFSCASVLSGLGLGERSLSAQGRGRSPQGPAHF